ncbi:MAG: AMP-binding protein, partial [Candidatus Zixiibacteriota bacterium]
IEEANKIGLPLFTTYGLTEMASQVTTTAPQDDRERLYTSGRVLKHREIRISNDREILVKGKTLFTGYVTQTGIETPFDGAGWFATGDLGRVDADGYLVVTGRKDNMFVSGGENIYPEEIEEAIRQLAGVDDVIVVPVDDEKFGQRPVAFVKYVPGKERSPEILLKELGKHLPKFKIPTSIHTWPADVPQAGIKSSRAYFQSLLNR